MNPPRDFPVPSMLEKALPPEMTLAELGQWLEVLPSPGPWRAREARLRIGNTFAVTPSVVSIAEGVIGMMRVAAAVQDPRLAEARARVVLLAQEVQKHAGKKKPEFNLSSMAAALGGPHDGRVMGMVVSGITGVGKTRVIQRTLSGIAQVVDHQASEECGFFYLKQLVHITVQISGDGSLRAFAEEALQEMDRVLGTSYLQDMLKRKASVFLMLLYFRSRLALHRTLLLVVEEAQGRSLFGRYSDTYQAFFLHALNDGIPVVVVGNPAGIDPLLRSSQVRRRLTSAGLYELHPVADWQDPDWQMDLVPIVWGATPFSEPDEVWCTEDELNRYLWQVTGGFKAHLSALRLATVLMAMRTGASRVEESHLKEAVTSPQYVANLGLSTAFAKRDAELLAQLFDDVNVGYYAQLWADTVPVDSGEIDTDAPPLPAPVLVAAEDGASTEKPARQRQRRRDIGKKEAPHSTVDEPGVGVATPEWLAGRPIGVD